MNKKASLPLRPDLRSFSSEAFARRLDTQTIGRRVHCFDTIASTNDVAGQLALQGEKDGSVVVAEEQSAGRGRLGREWFSTRSEGLYASLILRPAMVPRLAPMLNLVAAVAVSQAIERLCGLKADIKWPNDILINYKKCCGILTEMNADGEELRFLVAGMGVNVSQRQLPTLLVNSSTSILLESGRMYSRENVLAVILNEFEVLYRCFLHVGASAIIHAWAERSSYAWGKKVSVNLGDRILLGTTHGLSDMGALRVVSDSGQIEEIMSGDIAKWE